MGKCKCPSLSGVVTLAGVRRRGSSRKRRTGLSDVPTDLARPVMVCNKIVKSTRPVCTFKHITNDEDRLRAVATYFTTKADTIADRCSAARGELGTKEVVLCDGRRLNQFYQTTDFSEGKRRFSKLYVRPHQRSVKKGATVAVYRRRITDEAKRAKILANLSKAQEKLRAKRAEKKKSKAAEE